MSEPVQEKKEEKQVEEKIRRVASYILPDGSPVELLYDPKRFQTRLVVNRGGTLSVEEKIKIDDKLSIAPLPPTSSLLESGFILFPSMAVGYESEQVLYEEVDAFINKYVQLPDEFRAVAASYAMLTWVYDAFSNIAYLRAIGLHGSGKSRLLEVVGHLSYKAMLAGGSTSTAALFRILNEYGGTFIFDESDLSAEAGDMRAILRQGFNSTFVVTRMEATPSGNYRPRTFKVFGPKIMASREKTSDVALESRCLSQQMYPIENPNRPIELGKGFKEEARLLRNKLVMFRLRNINKIAVDDTVMAGISLPRLKQTGLAIMTVAKMLGEKPFADVKAFLEAYEAELSIEQADSIENDILISILDLLSTSEDWSKMRIGIHLTPKFNSRFYDDYSNKESKQYQSRESGLLVHQAYRVSAKKMGGYARKMGLKLERDSDGFYIPIPVEYRRIRILAKRYGLDKQFLLPDDSRQAKKIVPDEAITVVVDQYYGDTAKVSKEIES